MPQRKQADSKHVNSNICGETRQWKTKPEVLGFWLVELLTSVNGVHLSGGTDQGKDKLEPRISRHSRSDCLLNELKQALNACHVVRALQTFRVEEMASGCQG